MEIIGVSRNYKAVMIKNFAFIELAITIILAFVIGYQDYYSIFYWELVFGISALGVSLFVILMGVSEAIQIAHDNSHRILMLEATLKNKN